MKKEEKTVQFFVTKTFCFALFFFFQKQTHGLDLFLRQDQSQRTNEDY